MHQRFGLKAGYGVTMSKGVHIVVPGNAIKSNTGIILKTAISVLFLIPWGDKWIVGTTDTPYDGDRAHPYATSEDVQYILDQANKVLDPQLKREEIIGVAEVRDVFRSSKFGAVAGSLVIEGTVKKSKPIRVLRNQTVIFQGELESLRRFKDNVEEVRSGTECGIAVKAYNDVKPGDMIECFERIEVARSL